MPRAQEFYREIALKSAYFLPALSENPFVIKERKLLSLFLRKSIDSQSNAVPGEIVVPKQKAPICDNVPVAAKVLVNIFFFVTRVDVNHLRRDPVVAQPKRRDTPSDNRASAAGSHTDPNHSDLSKIRGRRAKYRHTESGSRVRHHELSLPFPMRTRLSKYPLQQLNEV